MSIILSLPQLIHTKYDESNGSCYVNWPGEVKTVDFDPTKCANVAYPFSEKVYIMSVCCIMFAQLILVAVSYQKLIHAVTIINTELNSVTAGSSTQLSVLFTLKVI